MTQRRTSEAEGPWRPLPGQRWRLEREASGYRVTLDARQHCVEIVRIESISRSNLDDSHGAGSYDFEDLPVVLNLPASIRFEPIAC